FRMPVNREGSCGNRSFASRTICPPAGISAEVERPLEVPSRFSTSKPTLTDFLFEEFAMVTRDCIDPGCPKTFDDSMYMRDALAAGSAANPAVETAISFRVYEKIAKHEGVAPAGTGAIRTDPGVTSEFVGCGRMRNIP